PAGVSGSSSPSTPTPTAAHAAIAGSSSTVRCRTERWSRSYRPNSLASTTQPGSSAIAHITPAAEPARTRLAATPAPTSARASIGRRRGSRKNGSPRRPPPRALRVAERLIEPRRRLRTDARTSLCRVSSLLELILLHPSPKRPPQSGGSTFPVPPCLLDEDS